MYTSYLACILIGWVLRTLAQVFRTHPTRDAFAAVNGIDLSIMGLGFAFLLHPVILETEIMWWCIIYICISSALVGSLVTGGLYLKHGRSRKHDVDRF